MDSGDGEALSQSNLLGLKRRTVKSFVRREGRITESQKRAFDLLMPKYCIDIDQREVDLEVLFGRKAPVVLEIGFGNGESLAQQARLNPDYNFIGVEVHRPGVGQHLRRVEEFGLENVRVVCGDAFIVLEQLLLPGSCDRIQLFFPDPWPKKRHHKRRILNPNFLQLSHNVLRQEGVLHMATDWVPYADVAVALLQQSELFENLGDASGCVPKPEYRVKTKFEQRGERLGHEVRDIVFGRCC